MVRPYSIMSFSCYSCKDDALLFEILAVISKRDIRYKSSTDKEPTKEVIDRLRSYVS